MPRRVLDTKKATREEWLQARAMGIGGSDAATLVHMNPYSGPLTLYSRKIGLVNEIEDNEAMRLGRDLEQYVADRFAEKTGKKTRNDFFMYADDEHDFLIANIDRRVVGENAALECKTMGGFNGYNLEAMEVPSHYYCQCQHYCMVMNLDRVYLAILVLQKGLYVIPIDRSDSFIEVMRDAEIRFWLENVVPKQMPVPDGGEADQDTLQALYPESVKETEMDIIGLDQMIEDYKAAGEMEKHYKEIKEQAKQKVCAILGPCEAGVGEKYGCTWKTQSKTSFDAKRFEMDHPEMYREYCTVSSYRTFRTKTLKKR